MAVMVKEEQFEMVEVRRVSDIVMAVVFIFEEDVMRLIGVYAPQRRKSFEENCLFIRVER